MKTPGKYAGATRLKILFFIFGLFDLAVAGNFYVDSQNGSDQLTGKSVDQAWKSLAQANKAPLSAGDTLFLKCDGDWTGALNIKASGSQAHPIVLTSYGQGQKPVLENPGQTGSSALTLAGNWLIVESILVRKVFKVGIEILNGADYAVLRNIEVTDCGIGASLAGRFGLVTGSYFHDLHIVVNTNDGGDDDYGAVGVLFNNSDNEVSYNRFVRCVAPSFDYGVDGGAVEIWADKDIRNIYVHHNSAYRCSGFFEIGGQGFVVDGIRAAYNEIVDCFGLSYAYVNNGGTYTIKLKSFRWENNTMVVRDCPNEKIWTSIAFTEPSDPGVFIMRNNLFYLFNAERIIWNVTEPIEDHNLFYHGGTAWFELNLKPSATDIVDKDPMLMASGVCKDTIGNFRFKPGSPAIDNGVDLGYSKDFQGGPVPFGSLPDIGANEFTTGTPVLLPSGRTRQLRGGLASRKGYEPGWYSLAGSWYSLVGRGRGDAICGQRIQGVCLP